MKQEHQMTDGWIKLFWFALALIAVFWVLGLLSGCATTGTGPVNQVLANTATGSGRTVAIPPLPGGVQTLESANQGTDPAAAGVPSIVPTPAAVVTNIGTYRVHLTNFPIEAQCTVDGVSWTRLGWWGAGDGWGQINNGFTNAMCWYRCIRYTN